VEIFATQGAPVSLTPVPKDKNLQSEKFLFATGVIDTGFAPSLAKFKKF
jgi:hypothetical protein